MKNVVFDIITQSRKVIIYSQRVKSLFIVVQILNHVYISPTGIPDRRSGSKFYVVPDLMKSAVIFNDLLMYCT